MKKTFIAFLLLVATLITANAQSLTGKKWGTILPNAEDGVLLLSFEDNGGVMVMIGQDREMKVDDMSILLHFVLVIPASYTIDNNRLLCEFYLDGSLVDIDYDINGVDEGTKPLIDSMLKPEFERWKPDVKQELLPCLPKMDSMKIVSLTNDTLILADKDGQTMTFHAAE